MEREKGGRQRCDGGLWRDEAQRKVISGGKKGEGVVAAEEKWDIKISS